MTPRKVIFAVTNFEAAILLLSCIGTTVLSDDAADIVTRIIHLPERNTIRPVTYNGIPTKDVQMQDIDPYLRQSSSRDSAQRGMDDAAKKLYELYTAIRNVALPKSDTTLQRLVMLLPGKVLNYFDYYPGKAYEKAIDNIDHTGAQISIPVRVMENMFALADVMPGLDPLHGSDTGESLAELYSNLLNWMQIKGFNENTLEEKKNYLLAVEYLTQKVHDPLNVSVNITRFNLYRRCQDEYNAKRRDMENSITAQKKELIASDYERWFRIHYPILKYGVEVAYTNWLNDGQKERVERYRNSLDARGPGIDLEEARVALRSAGVISLDRSRTVYPVSFVPYNWYRYLLDLNTVYVSCGNGINDH